MTRRPLLPVVLATAGIALGLALPSAARAAQDQCAQLTCLAKDPTAANITAFGGAQAWSRRSGGSGKDKTYRLVVRTNGVVADAPIPEFTRFAVDPDLGPDRKGGIVAVYSRCTPKKCLSIPAAQRKSAATPSALGSTVVGVMSRSADTSIKRLEEQLEGAEKTLSALRTLDRKDAERVGERMDRLASQLLAVTEPRSMVEVHRDLGIEPLGEEELGVLIEEMSPPDGEG